MGNNNNTPMAQQASARIIGPMWKKFMDYALTKVPEESFEEPDPIDPTLKPFLRGAWQTNTGEVHSELFWINRSDVKGKEPGFDSNDPLFRNFEAGVQNWGGTYTGSWSNVVTPPSTIETPPSSPQITIISPAPNSAVNYNNRVNITATNIKESVTQVQYYINNTLIGTSNTNNFSYSFIPSQIPGIEDENELKAVTVDTLGKSQEHVIYFSVIR
jgi:hypothetical protein